MVTIHSEDVDPTGVIIPEPELIRTGGTLQNSSILAAVMFLLPGSMLGGVSFYNLKRSS